MNETKMNDTAMDTVNKALTISNRQHEVFSHVWVMVSVRGVPSTHIPPSFVRA